MDLGIRGKRALVLGSSSGIGRSIAAELAAEGAQVALCSRNRERLERALGETGASRIVVMDLRKPHAGRTAVEEAARALGGLDILVTNSGGPPSGTFESLEASQWEEAHSNLWLSTVEGVKAALPGMRERRWGRIVFVTSVAAREVVPGLIISCAYRAGLHGFASALSREVAADGITVNAVLPGYTRTERLLELGLPLEEIAQEVPARRLAEPEEIGRLATFLCSEAASYITGQAVACDGGWLRGH